MSDIGIPQMGDRSHTQTPYSWCMPIEGRVSERQYLASHRPAQRLLSSYARGTPAI